ncbi:MAG TPA: GNAT family N-acetyltransferase [Candidatus Deferrimicrobium sp.]|nr:GNAT family N-acetyltransferase [Candidatus Deferrimicrobium sp.]
MKENLYIRKYKNSDLESAINVYKHLCEFYKITIHDVEEIKKFFSVRSYFEQYYTPCAFDSTTQKVVGLAFTEVVTEETQQVSGYIKLIYVEEEYRHQGLMTALINNAIEYFKKIPVDQVRIYLHNENLPYLSYYSDRLGFSPIITIVEKSLTQK